MFNIWGGRSTIQFINYMTMGLVHINGGQGVTFNEPWEMCRESLKLGPSVSLAFHLFVACYLLLLYVREGDGDSLIDR